MAQTPSPVVVAPPSSNTNRFSVKDFLAPSAILAHLDLTSKKDILQDLSRRAANHAHQNEHTVFDVLWARERLGTTAVGQGIAIPHGRVLGLKSVHGFFARLSVPVAFEAIDDKPVDLIFLLLSPEEAGADHLNALATVSRLLRDTGLCGALRRAPDEAEIYRLLTESSNLRAA